ncbi:heavy metal-associated domain-containing protein [uncultured Tenacibaculum sp.]|uniref:heavy-metal-associated domain-containing protein n=1 Tax=uncultured Tenacibaculum sp. TaxID=174713 RepID=UPI0026339841|nr:heavy metal-associated domain-containing protein [uncultured Tenacibaculum sp.]
MKSTIIIQNLKCSGCSNTIVKKVSQLEAISEVEVDVDNSTVSFNYSNESDVEMVKKTLYTLGYPEENDPNSISRKVKSFISCANGRMS